ncbi:MAG: cytochrome C [Ectothiorhodospiraceae bacterium]|nr:cytochrome C [Ectothiorhodospiraceae bacterium]MCH8506920.1 cytochrome C [Ectothiorhodospiraceae bacterium]
MTRIMPRHVIGLSAAALLLFGGQAMAEEPISYEQASLLASTCFACHGTDGRKEGNFAPIAGRPYESLNAQLIAFRNDQVPGTTVMNRLAAGYSEAELEAIALYLSGITDRRRD